MSAFVNRLILKHNLSSGSLGFYDYFIYFIMFYSIFIKSCNIGYVSLSSVKLDPLLLLLLLLLL